MSSFRHRNGTRIWRMKLNEFNISDHIRFRWTSTRRKTTAHTHWFKPFFGVLPLIRCFHGTYHWWLCLYFMTPLITACFFAPNRLSFSYCPISNRRKTRFVLKVSRFVILVLFNRTWQIQYSCSENQKLSDSASHSDTFVICQCVLLIDQLINHFN